jgi:hypothetical protein
VVSDANSTDGAYLYLNGTNQSALSGVFVVPTDAQSLRFDYWAWTPRNPDEQSRLFVEVFSGSDFAVYTLLGTVQGSQNQGWKQGVVNLQAFQGRTIKLRLRTDDYPYDGKNGQARVDNLTLHTEVPGWTSSDATRIQVVNDANSKDGAYLHLNGTNQSATSTAFQVPNAAQNLRFDYWAWTPRNPDEQSRVFVEVLSGSNFAVYTHLGTVEGSQNQGWKQGTVNLQAFQGRTVKLRLRADDYPYDGKNGQARLDNLAVGTGPEGAGAGSVTNPDGSYLYLSATNAWAQSAPFQVPNAVQSLRFDYWAWTPRNANETSRLFVEVFSGSDFTVYTLVATLDGTHNQGWKQGVVNLQAFQGRTVKLRLRSDDYPYDGKNGQVRVDNLTLHTEVPGWTSSDATRVQVVNDTNNKDGTYLHLNGTNQWALSRAFQVPNAAQSLRFDYWAWTPRNPDEQSRVFVEVFSGSDFAVYSNIGTVQGSHKQGWQQGVVNLQAFRGRTIKLRLRTDDYPYDGKNGQARLDNIAMVNDMVGPPAGYDYHLSSYLQINGTNQWALSSPITVLTTTTSVYFDYIAWTPRNGTEQSRLFVEVLSGANFDKTTLIHTAQGSAIQGWREGAEANLVPFQGQTIKLRFRTDDYPYDGKNGHAWIDQVVVGNRQAVTTPASNVAASSSACTVYPVAPGTTRTGEDNPTIFTTPSEPYIVRLHARSLRLFVGGVLHFTAGDAHWFAGTEGDAVGGSLPQGVEGRFHLRSSELPDQKLYAEVCTLGKWQSLMSFRPDADLQDALRSRTGLVARNGDLLPFHFVHRLEWGTGEINLDYYPVIINKLPNNPDTGVPFVSGAAFLEYIRTHINDFTGQYVEGAGQGAALADFSPYSVRRASYMPVGSTVDDNAAWANAPRGALISILLNANAWGPDQHGSVLASRHTLAAGDAHWIFSSAYTSGDGTHPVSGNRQFGVLQTSQNEWVFYTMATDRLTHVGYDGGGVGSAIAFGGGDTLWTNLRLNLVEDIRDHNGIVQNPGPRDSARYKWSAVCQTYWRPTVAWTSYNSTTCE